MRAYKQMYFISFQRVHCGLTFTRKWVLKWSTVLKSWVWKRVWEIACEQAGSLVWARNYLLLASLQSHLPCQATCTIPKKSKFSCKPCEEWPVLVPGRERFINSLWPQKGLLVMSERRGLFLIDFFFRFRYRFASWVVRQDTGYRGK